MIRAASGHISQDFSAGHQAVDIANAVGTPIYAPVAGVVTHVGQLGAPGGTSDPGNVVQIGDTINGHRLCHLSSWVVSVGQQVAEGQVVGYMGYSGYTIPDDDPASSHLHWIMWLNGVRVRALDYISSVADQIKSTGDDDVIRREDAHIVRIISSEVKGWDFSQVHSGATDAREIQAWEGKPWTRLIEEGWREAEPFRNHRIAAIDYFNNTRPHVEARVAELEASNSRQSQLLQTVSIERDTLQSELDALKSATKAVYDFVDDPRVVTIHAQADRLNLRRNPDTTSEIVGHVADGAAVAVSGFISNGAAVNGNTRWYKTLNGHYFTAAYADADERKSGTITPESEMDAHIQANESDWRVIDESVAGLYEATQTVNVYDYSNQVEPVVLYSGMKFNVAGQFSRLGVTYLLTDNSRKAGVWRGIPKNATNLIRYDDKLLDSWLASDAPLNGLDELAEAIGRITFRDRLLAFLGRPFAIIANVLRKKLKN